MGRSLFEMSWTLNGLLMALVVLVVIEAQGAPGPCVPTANVQKNSFWTVSSKSELTISCPVIYCQEIPIVKWVKMADMDKWMQLNITDQITITQKHSVFGLKVISYLSFKSISKYDNGLYRCIISESNFTLQSHSINISVSAANCCGRVNSTLGQIRGTVSIGWLPYVFICLGILGLITVVMVISFLSIYGCRCSKAVHHKQHHPEPCVVPPNQTLLGKAADGRYSSQTKPGHPNNVYNTTTEMEEVVISSQYPGRIQGQELHRSGDVQENSRDSMLQQIVYATLEHLPPKASPGPGYQLKGQFLEYASIRTS